MKKSKQLQKKLQLNRETISELRLMSQDELVDLAGGTLTATSIQNCIFVRTQAEGCDSDYGSCITIDNCPTSGSF